MFSVRFLAVVVFLEVVREEVERRFKHKRASVAAERFAEFLVVCSAHVVAEVGMRAGRDVTQRAAKRVDLDVGGHHVSKQIGFVVCLVAARDAQVRACAAGSTEMLLENVEPLHKHRAPVDARFVSVRKRRIVMGFLNLVLMMRFSQMVMVIILVITVIKLSRVSADVVHAFTLLEMMQFRSVFLFVVVLLVAEHHRVHRRHTVGAARKLWIA
mmetsp:Transcript_6635/g.14178  ORF Transcript_6635/g.14178 Transcript_6635/m.14178 type:complete len:213 (+) Transcript_6635:59-697(+)